MRALGDEFVSGLSAQDLRALMFRVGTRFGVDNPLPACVTLDELQQGMTAQWSRTDWGWVTLSQKAEYLQIEHSLSPLQAAFGPGHAQWSAGFLEGVYQRWLEQMGSGQLRVRQVTETDAWGCVTFQLTR